MDWNSQQQYMSQTSYQKIEAPSKAPMMASDFDLKIDPTGKEPMPIYLITYPIDFRGAINGLCMYIAGKLNKNPQVGVYVFFNDKRDQLKLLHWNYNGFILTYKCLQKGHFHVIEDKEKQLAVLTLEQLNWLFLGLDWQLMSQTRSMFFHQYA